MNIGATVTTTISTKGLPSSPAGAWRKEESTRDPPSIITDLSPSVFKIPGRAFGGILPAHRRKFSFDHHPSVLEVTLPFASSGTGMTLAPAASIF